MMESKDKINELVLSKDFSLVDEIESGVGVEAVKTYIRHGADVNEKRNNLTPLNVAIRSSDLEMVRVLIDAGAILNKKHLWVAAIMNKRSVVELLLDTGMEIPNGISALTLLTERSIHELLMERSGESPNGQFLNSILYILSNGHL